jgi:hypothetical protein
LLSVKHDATIGTGDVHIKFTSSSEIWFKVIQESCNSLTENLEKANETEDVAWEFSSALFLCMTILTTIGNRN